MKGHTKRQHLASFTADKAVQDNIVKSWHCIDCGVNTHPGCPSGPQLRLAFAMGADSDTVHFDLADQSPETIVQAVDQFFRKRVADTAAAGR